jgi:hypothetical protein
VPGRPDHVLRNRAFWNELAREYAEPGRSRWADTEPSWGRWGVPEAQLRVLPSGLEEADSIELGCGTAYVSAWLARRGAKPVGIDNSEAQPFGKTFTSTISPSLLETVTGTKVTCKSGTDSGEIQGPQNGTMKMIFTGCKMKKVPCNTPGTGAGVIATNPLIMKINYISKAKKWVGIDLLEPAGGPFLTYGCGSVLRGVVVGSVIGRITPVNKPVKAPATFALKFSQALGVQNPTKLELQPVDVLETTFGGPFEGTGLSATDQLLFGATVTLIA